MIQYSRAFVLEFAKFYHKKTNIFNRDVEAIFNNYLKSRKLTRRGKDLTFEANVENLPDDYTEVIPETTATAVLDRACYLFDVLEHQVKTGGRYEPLPDVRKLISRTLHDIGYSPTQISDALREYLGSRTNVNAQINETNFWHLPTKENQYSLMIQMSKDFKEYRFVNN